MENSQQDIIANIMRDANAAAEELVETAQTAATERIASAETQVARVASEEDARTKEIIRKIKREADAKLKAISRKSSLELRDKIHTRIIRLCEAAFNDLIKTDTYSNLLLQWIVEGTIGLQSDDAIVSSTAEERKALEEALPKAISIVERQTGKTVKLKIGKSDESLQGVVVTSRDGRMAYNNQVRNRMSRYQSEIQKLVAQRLFQDKE